MKKKLYILLINLQIVVLLFSSPAWAADLIYSQDFEGEGLELTDIFYTSHTWFNEETQQTEPLFTQSVSIVENSPGYEAHSGNKCIRGNVYMADSDFRDPITNKPGHCSPHLNIGYNENPSFGASVNFRDAHTDELYISFWIRFDEDAVFTRAGGNPGAYKMMYLSDRGGAITHYFLNRYAHKITSYSGTYYTENLNSFYNVNSAINDGQWHHFEVLMRYEDNLGDENGILEIYEDGELVYSQDDIIVKNGVPWTDGHVHFKSIEDARFSTLAFIHYTFGSDGSNGYMIDDIEIWDGLPAGGDTTPPIVNITSPNDDEIVSDTITITANASDNVGVDRVEFYINNVLKHVDTQDPYLYNWDTSTENNGQSLIKVIAYDTSNNMDEKEIVVLIDNQEISGSLEAIILNDVIQKPMPFHLRVRFTNTGAQTQFRLSIDYLNIDNSILLEDARLRIVQLDEDEFVTYTGIIIPTMHFRAGQYILRIQAEDQTGNLIDEIDIEVEIQRFEK